MKKLTNEMKRELEALKNISDNEINYSDIPEVTNPQDFVRFSNKDFNKIIKEDLNFNQIVDILEEIKQANMKDRVSLRLDHDVAMYYRQQGKKYQTRINDILRAFMIAEKQAHNH